MSRSSSSRGSAKGGGGESEANSRTIKQVIQNSCPENKVCFECGQRGPTYVDMTVGAFVCTKCSGMLRGINPPHRIKSISMSSFTSEEVEFLRARGNVYCAKVWLGLYDESHSGRVDVKDDDALKEFIIQKYERKRFYVDPSTIRHTSASTEATSVSDLKPASTLSSGLIGTTIQLPNHNRSRPGGLGSQRPTPSSVQLPSRSSPSPGLQAPPAPAPATSGNNMASLAGLTLSTTTPAAPAATPAAPEPDPFAAIRPPPQQSAFGAAFPPAPSPNNQNANNYQNAFGASPAVSVGKPQPTTATSADSFANFANFDAAVFPPPSASNDIHHQPATTTPNPTSNTASAAASGGVGKSKPDAGGDRYAALKDLDEIFKTTVNMSEPAATGTTAGASLFGSSPVQPAATISTSVGNRSGSPAFVPTSGHQQNFFGNSQQSSNSPSFAATSAQNLFGAQSSSTNRTMSPSFGGGPSTSATTSTGQNQNFFGQTASSNRSVSPSFGAAPPGQQTQGSFFGLQSGVSNSSPVTVPSSSNGAFFGSTGAGGVGGSDWAKWPSSGTGQTSSSNVSAGAVANTNGGSANSTTPAAPINPFTGASNLTQLNTSPWPTTGTSPVQSSAPAWPPVESTGGGSVAAAGGGFGAASGASSTSAAAFGGQTAITSNNKSFSSSNRFNTSSSSSSGFPDPFGAAPTSSSTSNANSTPTNQQFADSTDLFANAPKPNLTEKKQSQSSAGGGFASFNNFQQHQESQQASSAEQGPLAPTNNNNNNHGNVTKADNNVGEGPFQNAFSAGGASDPWANTASSSTAPPVDNFANIFTSAMMPAANPNNPFL